MSILGVQIGGKTKCRLCMANIVWLKTRGGKTMPTDAETVTPGDTEFDQAKHTSHFATCPFANQHRRKK